MQNYFHEAKVALNTAKSEFTSISSLSVMGAYSTNQACENSVRAIWEIATGHPFPHEAFKPLHKPAIYIHRIGLFPYYSTESRIFLDKLTGYAIDDARYQNTQAYVDHTKPDSAYRGKDLIEGAERMICETELLSKNQQVLKVIRDYEVKLSKTAKPSL